MRSTKPDFLFSKQVGTGTYGVVWQAVRKLDGKTYAVKELDLRYLQKRVNLLSKRFYVVFSFLHGHSIIACMRQEQIECIREIKVLSDLSSPYIIKYFDSFLDQVLHSCISVYIALLLVQ